MSYKAYLKAVDEYHGSIQITAEYRDPLIGVMTKTFVYAPGDFSVNQAKSDIVAHRDVLNTLVNKVEQLRAFIGQEVT